MKHIKYLIAIACIAVAPKLSALNYYWVGGNGNWSDYANHWATSSGGPGRHTQVPISTDDVFFDANSFTGNGQSVNINVNAVCKTMDWTNAGSTFSGAVNGPNFTGGSNIEIFGSFILDNRMRDVPYTGVLRFLSTGAETVDAKGVYFTHFTYDEKLRFEGTGNWTFGSSFKCIGGLKQQSGTINFGSTTQSFGQYEKEGGNTAVLNMGSSTITLTGPGKYAYRPEVWGVNTSNFTFNRGTSTIVVDFQNVNLYWAASNQNRAIFSGAGLSYFNLTSTDNTLLQLEGNNTFNDVTLLGKAEVRGSNTLQNTLTLTKGYEYVFNWDATQTFGASAKIVAVGDCQNYVYILSDKLPTSQKTNFITAASWAGSTIDYAIIYNTRFTGGITATNSVDNGLNVGITFPAQTAVSNFWRGGSGDWDVAANWSRNCVPTPNDNVFFDASSFTAPGQKVTISKKNAYCKSMDWTGATNNPELTSTGILDVSLNVHGSLKFIPGMIENLQKPTNFWGAGAGNQITSATRTFKAPVYFKGTGTYTLQDAFEIEGMSSNTSSGVLYFNAGTLTTNNQTVKVRRFQSRDNGVTKVLNMGSSVFTINNNLTDGTFDNFVWWAENGNMTINAGTSKISVDNDGLLPTTRFRGGNGFTYYDLEFLDLENEPEIHEDNDNTSFRSVTFAGNGKFSSTINITNTVGSQIAFSAGKTYKIEAGKTINIGADAVLLANGNCSDYINIQSTTTSQAFFSKTSGLPVSVSYVTVKNIGVGTVAFNANPGLNLGGNGPWTFTNPAGRTLYWVGGTGNWNDATHWSLTSGGAGGACPPLLTDSVYFNASSFTAAGQSVTINVNPASCKNMDWTGVTNTPSLVSTIGPNNELSIYGSLKLSNNMNVSNFRGNLNFKGTGSNSVTTNGKVLQNDYINFDAGTGTYTMADDFATSTDDRKGAIHLVSGTLNTNGKTMLWNGFTSYQLNNGTQYTNARTLNLGNSKVTINGRSLDVSTSASWDARGVGMSLNAGTSSLFIRSGPDAQMANFTYNNLTTVFNASEPFLKLLGNATYKSLRLNSNTAIRGNNTVNDTMYFAPGGNYIYDVGTTQNFSGPSKIILLGTPTQKIFIQTPTLGQFANWVKPSGVVCTVDANIRDNHASGGAIFSLGSGPNDQGGNKVWDFKPFELPGSVSLSGSNAVCSGVSTNLTFALTAAYPKIITYTDGTTNFTTAPINSSPFIIPISTTTNKTYSIVSVDVNVCVTGPVATSGTASITIIAPPAITTQPSNSTICTGDNTSLTVVATGSALTYQWKENGSDILADAGIYNGVNTSTLTLTGATVGNNYSVFITGSCGNITSSAATLTIKPRPTVTNGPTASACSGTPISLALSASINTSTFAWNSTPVAGISGNSISGNGTPIVQTLTNATSAPININYTVTATENGCPGAPSVIVVTVNPKPKITNPLTASVCSGNNTAIALQSDVSLPTFAWITAPVTNITGNTDGSGDNITQLLTNSTTAPLNVSYTVTPTANSCPGTPSTVVVTVNPKPKMGTVTSPAICSGTFTNIALTSTVGGATYAWTSAVVAGVTGNSNGSGTPIAQQLTNSTVLPVNVAYVLTPTANTCPGFDSIITVTVNPTPLITNTLDTTICSGNITAIKLKSNVSAATFAWTTITPTTGITGNSNGNNLTTIAQILTNSTNSAVNVNYTVTPTANLCAGTPSVIVVTVNPKPVINNTLTHTVCSEGTTAISLSSTVAGSTFAWTTTAAAGVTGNIDGNTNTIAQKLTNTTTLPVNVIYAVKAMANTCEGNPSNVTVTVNPKPAITNLLTSGICSGTTTSVNLTSNVAGATFAWTSAAVAGISGNSNGSGPTIAQGLTNTTGSAIDVTYSVSATANSCTGNPSNVVITVSPRPVVNNPLTASICSGSVSDINLTSNVSTATFVWATSAVANITGNADGNGNKISQKLTNATNAAIKVSYAVTPTANLCVGATANVIVTVIPAPSISNPLTASICSGNATSIALTSNPTGASFTWTTAVVAGVTGNVPGSGASISQGLNNITNAPIDITYVVTPSANACDGAAATITVIVNPRPAITNTLDTAICSGNSTKVILKSNVAGAVFAWTSGAVTGVAGNSSSSGAVISQALTNSTSNPIKVTYAVTATANGCPGAPPTNVVVTVNPIPNVAPPLSFNLCSAATTNIPLASSVSGASFTWTTAPVTDITGNTNGAGNNISHKLENASKANIIVNYAVTPTANLCSGSATTINVTVRPIPAITSKLKDSLCTGGTTSIALGSDVAGAIFAWTTATVAGATGNTNGSGNTISQKLNNSNSVDTKVFYAVTPSIAGCPGIASNVAVNIYPSTVPGNVTGGSSICEGTSSNPLILSGNTGSVINWESSVSPFTTWTPIAFTGTAYTSGNLTQTTRFRAIVASGLCSNGTSGSTEVIVVPGSVNTGTMSPGGTICSGSTAGQLTLSGYTGTFIRWEKSISPFSTWDLLANVTDTYAPGAPLETTRYRAILTSGACASANSPEAIVTVNNTPTITVQPVAPPALCENAGMEELYLTAAGTGSSLSYQWREEGVNIADGGIYTNATTNSLTITKPTLDKNGKKYDVVISGSCGTRTSDPVFLTVYGTTKITSAPPNPTIACEGSGTSFTVTTTGNNLSYQWREDGINISDGGIFSGTKTILLNLSAVSLSQNNKNYDVLVTGTCGTATSSQALLNVRPITAISTQPADKEVCAGTAASFTVAATGANLIYQWRDNGVNISNSGKYSGTTTSTLTIASTEAGMNNHKYDVVVTGACLSVTSIEAFLTINSITNIITSPSNKVICENTSTQFDVVASGKNLLYQWKENGVILSNGGIYSGVGTPTLNISAATLSMNSNFYEVFISGSCSDALSAKATLSVNTNPIVTTPPVNANICAGGTATFTVAATGTGLSYQWRENEVPLTNSGVYTGVTTALLKVSSPDITFDGKKYDVIVTGICGVALPTAAVTLSVKPLSGISAQPASVNICEGSAATFSVTSAGAGLTYQWREDDIDIIDAGIYAGAKTDKLLLSPANTALNGKKYYVVLTANCGNINSAKATLVVNTNTVVTKDPRDTTICAGANVSFTTAAKGTALKYQWKANNIAINGETNPILNVLNATTALNNVKYSVEVTGTCGPQPSKDALLTVNATTMINTQPLNVVICEGANAAFAVDASGTDLKYQWKQNGVNMINETTANLSITKATVAMNNNTYQVAVSGKCGSISSPTQPAILTVNSDARVVADPSNTTVCAGTNATYTVKATGTALTYQWRANGTNILNENNPTLVIANTTVAQTNTKYDVVITGTCKPATSAEASLTVNINTIVNPAPKSLILCAGAKAEFVIGASGTALTFQWKENDANILNETNSTYTINSVTEAMNGNKYEVVVTGACGIPNISSALLTVNTKTEITTQPKDASVCAGGSVSFVAQAKGTGIGYQWKSNGAYLLGETGSMFTIDNTTAAMNNRKYEVEINGVCGLVTSKPAILTINPNSVAGSISGGATICEGTTGNVLNLVGHVGNIVRWESAANPFIIWKPIANTTTINNVGVITETVQYRAVIQSGNCPILTATPATIAFQSKPSLSNAGSDQSLCDNVTAVKSNVPSVGTGKWSITSGAGGTFSDNTKANAIFTGIANTTYQLVWSISNGVCNPTTDVVSIQFRSIVRAVASKDTTIKLGKTANLTASGGVNYAWSPIETLTNPFVSNPVAKPTVTTTYIVTVSDNLGCSDTAAVKVIVDDYIAIKIPNSFSPNGDGQHDYWVLENVEFYPQATLDILNRWGQVIKTLRGGENIKWDGTNNAGVAMEVGTYFYVFKQDRNDEGKAASVTIVK